MKVFHDKSSKVKKNVIELAKIYLYQFKYNIFSTSVGKKKIFFDNFCPIKYQLTWAHDLNVIFFIQI